jgi:hypothetical protein
MALQIGGSHYPEVSQQYFEQTVRLVVNEIESVCQHHGQPINKERVLQHFHLDK